MQVAEERQKVVKLQFFPNAPYDAFVTPSSKKKIYFGPLSLDMPPPVLVLLQSVDRKMMLREVYQREHSIPVQRHRRSMAFWVLQINGQVHFEIDTESTAKLAAQQKNAIGTPPGLNVLKIPSQLSVEIEKNQDEVPPVVVIDSDEEDDDGERQLVIDEQDDEQAETDVKQEVERTGFTIQTLPSSGALQITISDSAETSSHPAKDVNTCHFSGGFMPFIANVPAKFGETAPTTQFLTPQVQVTTSQSGPETLTSSSSSHLPASKSAYPKINESLQELFSSGVPPGGITITKVDSQEKTLPNETVQVVKNKKSIAITGIHKQVTKAASSTATVTAARAPVVKPQSTSVSKVAPPIRPGATTQPKTLVRLYPKPALAAGRKSLPADAKTPVATPRQSQPVKVAVACDKPPLVSGSTLPALVEPSARKSLPSKPLAAGEHLRPRQSLPAKVTANPPAAARPDAASTSAQNLTNVSKAQLAKEEICYGIMVAKDLPRFRAKVEGSDFMIKIPEHGVFRFKTFGLAASFLSR